MGLKARLLWVSVLIAFAAGARAETAEQRTARRLASVRQSSTLLLAFLQEMPKGGDLHSHLSCAIYAESWIDYAAQDNLCVDRTASMLPPPPCDPSCATPDAEPGCQVTVRYLYQVLRGPPREMVFAQILLGCELTQTDPRFVGLNPVMPEDWYVPMHDFDLHMKMLDYLHGVYPKVHLSLHAGERAMGLVPPEGLGFHIRESIERRHAERIGHGVSVMNEHDRWGCSRRWPSAKCSWKSA